MWPAIGAASGAALGLLGDLVSSNNNAEINAKNIQMHESLLKTAFNGKFKTPRKRVSTPSMLSELKPNPLPPFKQAIPLIQHGPKRFQSRSILNDCPSKASYSNYEHPSA